MKKSVYYGLRNVWTSRSIKVTASVLLMALLLTSFLMLGVTATGTDVAPPMGSEQVVTVANGDTLWAIAGRVSDDSEDTGYIVFKIKQRNGLTSSTIHPGQQLIVPE
ncbi:LysM peptidoglycan-binding domain-containing protein [Paenibacillus chungangensis]|uniref:LysM peptidoglycan-binding domain-containing protein n=1 Tax=Paenibacillus chungangensis TaxID=696535 RepID=A0ABW3HN69_9BACL